MDRQKYNRLHVQQRQLSFLGIRIKRLALLNQRWSLARLLTFLLAISISSAALFLQGALLFWVFLLLLGGLFIATVAIHRRLERSIEQHRILRSIKSTQIARMTLDWANIPPAHITSIRANHPYELDIDLIGPRSLHRVIDSASTFGGSNKLRDWLTLYERDLGAKQLAKIDQRQKIVQELRPLHLFRTKLMLHGQEIIGEEQDELEQTRESKWDTSKLQSWFVDAADRSTSLSIWLVVLFGLAAANIVLALLYWLQVVPLLWPYSLALYAMLSFYLLNRRSGLDPFTEATRLQSEFRRLSAIFEQLEHFSYRHTPQLKELCHPFVDAEEQPSRYLRRLARIVNAAGIRGNPLIWLALNLVMPWDVLITHLLANAKVDIADHLPIWLDTWTELEALSCLANLAYLNPRYSFPVIVDASRDDPIFSAIQFGHPLLPDLDEAHPKVYNDFAFDALGQVGIITGSNMAGKSTFLKALGMNLALTFAGGATDSAVLRTQPLRLYTSIKVSDSVTDGISYFYAEVRRLKALLVELEKIDAAPLFFAIDEIFRGTNNRERLTGSRAYIRALADKHGIGFISTHDLELVKLADESPLISNYHFRDDVSGDQMVFDYTLRRGPSPTTNALTIMRQAGLPVDE